MVVWMEMSLKNTLTEGENKHCHNRCLPLIGVCFLVISGPTRLQLRV